MQKYVKCLPVSLTFQSFPLVFFLVGTDELNFALRNFLFLCSSSCYLGANMNSRRSFGLICVQVLAVLPRHRVWTAPDRHDQDTGEGHLSHLPATGEV